MEIKVDTQRMRECGTNMIKLAGTYRDVMNELFERIEKMPTVTKEWMGIGAREFVKNVNDGKPQYQELGEAIEKYGKHLLETADSMDAAVTRRRRDR